MPRKRREGKRLRPEVQPSGIWWAIGTVAGERIRKSLGTRDEARAKEQCALIEARIWKRHNYGDEAVRTFEEAALSYMEQGGESRFLTGAIKHFKGRVVGSISAGDVREAAIRLYPRAGAATRNRQAIVPIRAVLMHAHHRGWRGAIKVKQFEVPKSRKHKPVDAAWLAAFLAESDKTLPHLSALVLFMHDTAARVSEALRLTGEHVDLGKRTAVLDRTKTDEWSVRTLTSELVARLAALGLREGRPVFLYTDKRAVNRAMARVCKRAGIEARTTHSAGRHSFGTNTIAAGSGIKDAMDAGGWKSARLFLETYVHSTEAGRSVADMIDRQRGPIDINKAPGKVKRRATFGKRS